LQGHDSVFDGFKVDAPNAEGCALYVDFLELDRREDQQVEKPPGLLQVNPAVPGCAARSAAYVDRIPKGAKPGDLAVEPYGGKQLVINLKTAKALGMNVDASALRARKSLNNDGFSAPEIAAGSSRAIKNRVSRVLSLSSCTIRQIGVKKNTPDNLQN
jgi:hypothetical protein